MLRIDDIREKLHSNENKDVIAKAIRHEERLRFHSTTTLDANNASSAMISFRGYVDGVLQSQQNSNLFWTMFRYPVPSISLVESIFTDLKKVFEGQNAVQEFMFTDSTLREDWSRYSKEVLKEHQRWIGEGFQRFKYHINSFIVVDMPQVQNGEKPEPYYYWLNIEKVISFGVEEDSDKLTYIIFHQDNNHFVVIDDTYYRVCSYQDDINKFDVVSESTHDLGYCPVCFYWTDFLGVDKCLKESPLSKELDNLDYYIFKVINKRIADLGGEYPAFWHYETEQGCDYEDKSNGFHCDKGYLKTKGDEHLYNSDGSVKRCPICGDAEFRGAGSKITVPMPSEGERAIDNPIGIIVTPVDTLKFIQDSVLKLRQEIYNSVVGYDGYDSGTAMNELQIKSKFENRRTVLNRLKSNFENAQRFVEDTICRLRYGKSYLGCVIDYGTEFYIYTIEELRERYKQAKISGSSETELDYLADQIMYTENKTNPVQLERMIILKQLEPYRHLSLQEVVDIYRQGLIDDDLAKIKLNFSNLIARFERENTNIVEFGAGTTSADKIDKILETLKQYVNNGNSKTDGRKIGF